MFYLKSSVLKLFILKNNHIVCNLIYFIHCWNCFCYNFQYIIIFDIEKSNHVLPLIEDLEDKIPHYGFFRNADPDNPVLLCKDYELLATYGMEKIG